jgi:hypothetical protein
MSNKGNEVDIINREQAQVIEVAKGYADGFKTSVAHTKGYALLFGTALNQLKEITPHGGFSELAEKNFPDYKLRWLQNLMNFAEHRKIKNAVTAFLPDGQLLLALPEAQREELFEEVNRITGDKSIEALALEVVKKKHQAKMKDAPPPTVEQENKRRLESVVRSIHELRQRMMVLAKTKLLALAPDDELEALEEDRITFGRHIAEIVKHRKGRK